MAVFLNMINKSNKNSRDILASIATQKIFQTQKIKDRRIIGKLGLKPRPSRTALYYCLDIVQ